MEKWFLAGAVAGLLILLFDKPLAGEITSEFVGRTIEPPIPAPDVIVPNAPSDSGCGCAGDPSSAPQTPQIIYVNAPGAPPPQAAVTLIPAVPVVYATAKVYNNTSQQLGNRVNPSTTIPDIPNKVPKPMPFKATPLSPSPVIIGPANSQPIIGNRLHVQSAKSPAPKPALVDPDFKGFYYN